MKESTITSSIDKAIFTGGEYIGYYEFWRQKLAELHEPYHFSFSDAGPSMDDEEAYASTEMVWEQETSTLVSRLSGGDPFNRTVIVFSAIHLLLSTYSGEKVLIKTPLLAGPDTEGDLHTEQVVIPFSIHAGASIQANLESLKEVLLDCYQFQNYPLSQIFDNSLSFQELTNVSFCSDVHLAFGKQAGSGIRFSFNPQSDGYVLSAHYPVSRFEEEYMEGFLATVEQLIRQYTSPSRLITSLDLLTDSDKQQLDTIARTAKAGFPYADLVRPFEERVLQSGGAVALACEDKVLTYGCLNQQANNLAGFLRKENNLGREDLVGVMSEKSEFAIIGILAVLKAGGTYVPIDPRYPAERIKYLFRDAALSALLIDSGQMDQIADFDNPVFVLDLQLPFLEEQPGNLALEISPDQGAYVIYTSGSTGYPKGVLVEHRSIANTVQWRVQDYGLSGADVNWSIPSLAFDSSVEDIFSTLLSGGQLLIADESLKASATYFGQVVEQFQVTHFLAVSSLYATLLDELAAKGTSLRMLTLAGEPTGSALVQRHYQALPDITLYNEYGPTECAVCATACILEPGKNLVPIGRGISNTGIYILSAHQTLLPAGVIGEICIAGPGLARGYLNQPELTAEKFVTHPFESGARMYRTGDLGRWLPDGTIVFSGRKDEQVKIRGFRVELGEIENMLMKFPALQQAVVTVRENKATGRELHAYYVAAQALDISQVREFLRVRLPAYMIPVSFTALESLPLTPSGKVNRKRLPEPQPQHPSMTERLQEARNSVEKELATIWEQLLGKSPIGVTDDFFSLGGHSLIATQMVIRVLEAFQVKLPLKTVFDFPTIAELAGQLAALKPATPEGLVAIEEQEYYEVSHAQKRLWILDQFEENQVAYNIPNAYLLEGVHPDALEKAFQELLKRHESLRTTFLRVNGEIKQKIRAYDPGEKVLSVQTLPAGSDAHLMAKELAQQEAHTPFQLEKGPLFRARLLRVDANQWVLLFTIHHSVADGWSIEVLTKEVVQWYNAFARQEEIAVVPFEVQYKDYAAWQNQQLKAESLQEQQTYWLSQLAAPLPVLELPTDYARPPVKTFHGSFASTLLPLELSEQIRKYSQQSGASQFMTLLAVVKTLLFRYTGQRDLTVGTTVAGREQNDLERQIGFYVNTVVLRTRLTEENSFEDLLTDVKQTVLGAMEHQTYPFDRLVDELNVDRNLSYSPLFNVLVELINLDMLSRHMTGMEGVTVDVFENNHQISQYDLSFKFKEGPQIEVIIEYNSDLFRRSRVERMLAHFEQMTALLVQQARMPLSQIAYVPLSELEQIQQKSRGKTSPSFVERTVVDLFQAQVDRLPNAVALTTGALLFTYEELNRRANRLAHYLLGECGVRPGSFVAVMASRSADLIAGILAVLKAGAVLVPVEPGYPALRRAKMIQEVNAAVLITESALLYDIPAYEGHVFALDLQLDTLQTPETNPGIPLSTDLAAYVIFTSGSTGSPKGVLVEHGSLSNYLHWAVNTYTTDHTGHFGFFSSLSFDFSLTSLLCPIMSGKSLHVYSPDESIDAILSHSFSEASPIDTIKLTPSHLYVLNQLPSITAATNLRTIILGGEPLIRKQVELLWKLNPSLRIINEYGPTEVTVGCIAKEITPLDERILIGTPLDNLHVLILDDWHQPVPIGVWGEIWVGGKSLARGYINNPEITRDRFVTGLPGSEDRYYRTGDSGRWTETGEVESAGRIDSQLKIKGFRVEPGEIENVLAGHPSVSSVAIVAAETEPTELVAYVVLRQETPLAELKAYLMSYLPNYMIPADFVALAELPMNANGKLDIQALRKITPVKGKEGGISPRTRTEEQLCGILEEIIKKDNIGVEVNLFTIGLDSLKAIVVISQISRLLKADLRISDLFAHPTIQTLAAFLATERSGYSLEGSLREGHRKINQLKEAILGDSTENAALPETWEDFYPMTPIESGMIYASLLNPEEPIYYDNFLYQTGIRDWENFRNAFARMVERHDIFRTGYYVTGFREPLKVVLKNPVLPIFLTDLSGVAPDRQQEEIQQYLRKDLMFRLQFNGDLLWRLKIFHLGQQQYYLGWSVHHAMLDGWSVASFTTELSILLSGQVADLPPLKSTYKDYCALVLGRQEPGAAPAYWQKLLQGYSRNRLPFNFHRKKIGNDTGMQFRYKYIPTDVLRGLEQVAETHQVTLKAICLSAYLYLFGILTREDDIVVGVVSHDRPPMEDGEKILGCFLNTIPIRIKVSQVENALALVEQVQNYLMEVPAYEMHLADIAKAIGEKSFSGNPVFDCIMNFTDFHVYEKWKVGENLFDTGSLFEEETSFPEAEMTNTFFDLEVDKSRGNFSVKIKYRPAYFYQEDIESALELYIRILQQWAGQITVPLDESSLLTASDQEWLLYQFNDTIRPYSKDNTLNSLFEVQATSSPSRIAVEFEDQVLTYRELNGRANRLGRYLQEQGVKYGDPVGLRMARGMDMIVAAYAILKVGGSYVPVEPDYPAERQKYILENSDTAIVLVDKENLGWEASSPLRFLALNWDHWEKYGDGPVESEKNGKQLAYTIYTSGSTGRPKGVMIAHHAAINLVESINRRFGVGAGDRLLLVTSLCFDLSVYDIFGTLAAGGTLVVVPRQDIQSAERLAELLLEKEITFWDSVPTTMDYLVRHLEETVQGYRQKSLKRVFMSGDWIPVDLPSRLKAFFPDTDVISLGGATEGTVWSNYYRVNSDDRYRPSIPYGKPLDNNFFYILNRELKPVPRGVVGELFIGGVGVAEGYAKDEVKTSRAFLTDPFNMGVGGRMYRTGDLGRMLPEGTMEFIGRIDNQVKIRGYRVELGEIEQVLLQQPGIAQAIVLVRKDEEGINYLTAYYIAHQAIQDRALRALLGNHLPEYMVPSYFVPMDTFPLNANGKVDRHAFPEPSHLHKPEGQSISRPESETEKKLVKIWTEVLGLQASYIGTDSNFFAIGGHSLKATSLITRVHKEFNVSLTIPMVYQEPTLEGMAENIEKAQTLTSSLLSLDGELVEISI